LKELEIYLIRTSTGRHVIFSPSDIVEASERESTDHVRRSIHWLVQSKIRVVAWMGRVMSGAHRYYIRLEDRIDPAERILKAMASGGEFVVHYPASCTEATAFDVFKGILRKQRLKHVFWFVIDVVVCGVMVMFIPVLAPIPGPNVFLYYPFLRLLSHYRALRGIGKGLFTEAIQFKCLPELSGLEQNVRAAAERLKIRGLEQYLERMV
jgi:hypothetical protein